VLLQDSERGGSVMSPADMLVDFGMQTKISNVENEIEVMSGAYMMLRREALDKVGLLDEDFFMYGEDIDLSYRVLKGGYKNYFLPVRMLHYKGESTVKNSYRYAYTFYQAMRLFFRKHYGHYSFIISLPINAATWASTFMAYVRNRLRYRKKPKVTSLPMNALVVGDAEMIAEVKLLLEKSCVEGKMQFLEGSEDTLPKGHLSDKVSLKGFDTVVYDTEHYSYATILRLLELTPGNTLSIATYSAKTKVLITDGRIFRNSTQ
jgi:hypothetical protein